LIVQYFGEEERLFGSAHGPPDRIMLADLRDGIPTIAGMFKADDGKSRA